MRKKIAPIFLALFILLVVLNGAAWGYSYYGYSQWGGTWHDVNKTGTNDSRMCWAAAAANILAWGHWGAAGYNTATAIFDNFKYHWTNEGSLMNYGWQWWLNGTLPDNWFGWAQVNESGGGNYWPRADFNGKFYETLTGDLMLAVDRYLHAGYGVSIAIYKPDNGHALTVWGFEAGEGGVYQSIYATDSDDFWTSSDPVLKKFPVTWNSTMNYYELGGDNYSGWHIGEVQALDRNVPLPATVILFGSGLLGLVGLRRWWRN